MKQRLLLCIGGPHDGRFTEINEHARSTELTHCVPVPVTADYNTADEVVHAHRSMYVVDTIHVQAAPKERRVIAINFLRHEHLTLAQALRLRLCPPEKP